ncbi:MAG: glycosyltransferase family 2 protein [bacterium]|nr:glycosyltransferase family 2 protein [bacterium]
MYDLSLIIACYNEEQILVKNVSEIIEILDKTNLSYEIIFVDDCSKDRTREKIEEIMLTYKAKNLQKIFHKENIGRGGAVKDGIRMAKGKITGYIDVDLEVNAEYISEFVDAIKNGYDIAVAHRIYKFQIKLMGICRLILTKAYHWLVEIILGLPYKDTEAGYKFFDTNKIVPMIDEIKNMQWFWDTEFMARTYVHNYKVKEIPCIFIRKYERHSTVRIFSDSFRYFIKLLQFKEIELL